MRDVRLCEAEAASLSAARARYEELRCGAPCESGEDILPVREDFAAVYNFIRRQVRFGEDVFSVRELMLRDEAIGKIGYIKLRFILNVLLELNIAGIEELAPEKYSFKIYYQNKRADLEKSAILKKLRAQQKKTS